MHPEPRRLPPGRATWRQQLPRPPRPLDLDRHAAAALQVEPAISSSSTAAAAVAARGHWARRSIESQGIQALDHRVRNKGSVERRTPFGPALRSPRWTAPPIRSTRPGTRKWVAESRQKEFAMCGGPAVQARRPVVGMGGCWGVGAWRDACSRSSCSASVTLGCRSLAAISRRRRPAMTAPPSPVRAGLD